MTMEKLCSVSTEMADKIDTDTRPYTRLVNALSRNNPNLSNLAKILSQASEKGAGAVIKFRDTGAAAERFCTAAQLRDFLISRDGCKRRLFLVQGLPSNYVEILGAAFNIDPNFFARQISSGMPLHPNKGVRDIPLLASHPTSRESFCIRYHELREFADPISDWELQVIDQPRRVSVSKFNGEFDGIGIVRKTTSVWFRARGNEGGWDGTSLLNTPARLASY